MYEIKIKEMENPFEVFEAQGLPAVEHEVNKIKFLFETDVELSEKVIYSSIKAFSDEMIRWGFLGEEVNIDFDVEIFESENYSLTAYIL
jgi:hypothetical protein